MPCPADECDQKLMYYCDWVYTPCALVNDKCVREARRPCGCEQVDGALQIVSPICESCSDPAERCFVSLVDLAMPCPADECDQKQLYYCDWIFDECELIDDKCVKLGRRTCGCEANDNGELVPVSDIECSCTMPPEPCDLSIREQYIPCSPRDCIHEPQWYWCDWFTIQECEYNDARECEKVEAKSCACNATTGATPLEPCFSPISVTRDVLCDSTECECCIDYRTILKICEMKDGDGLPDDPNTESIDNDEALNNVLAEMEAEFQTIDAELDAAQAALEELIAHIQDDPWARMILNVHLDQLKGELEEGRNEAKEAKKYLKKAARAANSPNKDWSIFEWLRNLQRLLSAILKKLTEILSILQKLKDMLKYLLTLPSNWCDILKEMFRLMCLLLRCIAKLTELLQQLKDLF
jgi:hypothetical protein